MKTETLNNEIFTKGCAADYAETIIKQGKEVIAKTYEPFTISPNADIIIAALNSCKEINKDNPLAVAKMLPELFRNIDDLLKEVSPHIYKLGTKKGFSELVALEAVKKSLHKIKATEQ